MTGLLEQAPNPHSLASGAASHPESCQGCHSVPSSNRTWLLKDLSAHPPNMAAGVIPGCSTPRPRQPSPRRAGIPHAPSLRIAPPSPVLAPSASPPPRQAPAYLHLAKGHNPVPRPGSDADHSGGEGVGGPGTRGFKAPRRPPPGAAECAPGARPPARRPRPESGGSGKPRAGAGHCGRPSRPRHPRPGLARPGGSPAPPRAPVGRRDSRPARRFLRSDPARPRPGLPSPREPPPQPPRRQPPPPPAPTVPALPQPRCGPTGGRTGRVSRRRGTRGRGGPDTDAPQREQRQPRAAGRRSAAPSRSGPAPHRGPRRGEGGSAGGRGAKTTRRWQLRRTRNDSDLRWRLPRLPPSDCPASVLAKLRPQPPAPDTAPSPAAARHLGPPRRR